MPEIFIHLIQFLLDQLVLQLPIDMLFGNLFSLAQAKRATLFEGLMWFLYSSDLIYKFIDIPHGLDLDQDIFVCEIAV